MKAQITTAQAMSHPDVVLTINTLGKIADQYREQNQMLLEALKGMTDDYADRFDLDCPSTNPGIKYVIKQARAAIKLAEKGATP